MKKFAILLIVMFITSFASASVLELVTDGVGSMGNDGITTPLQAGETIPIKLVLNYNPHPTHNAPTYPSYEGYALRMLDVDIDVTGGTLSVPTVASSGFIKNAKVTDGLDSYGNGTITATSIPDFAGISLSGINTFTPWGAGTGSPGDIIIGILGQLAVMQNSLLT